MKAIRIHSHGGPEVMRLEDIEQPPPGPGEARVRHTAIGLNFSDINVRRGGFYQKEPLPMPIILGNEAAGVVTALGAGVTEVAVGDRVGYCGVGSNFFVQHRCVCGTTQCRRRKAGKTAPHRFRPAGSRLDAQGADRHEHRRHRPGRLRA